MKIEDGIKQAVTVDELLNEVNRLRNKGYRLIQISCTTLEMCFELYYSFGTALEMIHLRLEVDFEAEIPSITGFYYPAFLYENEMHDLFGLKIAHIALDYGGDLYRTARKSPFGPIKMKQEE